MSCQAGFLSGCFAGMRHALCVCRVSAGVFPPTTNLRKAMNTRRIREDLGRVRTCIQRMDYPRAIQHFCQAIRELGGQSAPMDIRGDFRSALTDLCANAAYRQINAQPLPYQPGKERELLAFFTEFYNQLVGQEDEEDYEQTLRRKLSLDRCLGDGKGYVSQGRFSEADDCFAKAITFYKDEIAAFAIMARAMMDAGQYVRALGYVRKGLEKQPDNAELAALGEECNRMRAAG